MSEERQRLAAQQAELMRALCGRDAAPPDFDAERVAVAADSLIRKRVRTVQQTWPRLTAALGERFAALFAPYAHTTSMPRLGGPLADGLRFADFLAEIGDLPDAALPEYLSVQVHYRTVPDGLVPRRGPCLRMMPLREARRLLVMMRWPGLGVWWIRLPRLGLFKPASATPGT